MRRGTAGVEGRVTGRAPRRPAADGLCDDPSVRRASSGGIVAEISPEGALAGHTISAVLIVSGLAFIGASSDELWRRCAGADEACATSAAAAGLVTFASIGAIVAGVVLELRVRRLPVDPEGSARLVGLLGALFAAGLLLVAWRIPAFTCERGRFDEVLELCMHPPSTSEPTSWGLLKTATTLLAVGGGITVALRPKWSKASALLAVAAWIAGAGWLMLDTLVGP